MARCEDFPCCGHEAGCCPDYDEGGRQLNMVCVCGKKLPLDNGLSLCRSCLRGPREDWGPEEWDEYAEDQRYANDNGEDD